MLQVRLRYCIADNAPSNNKAEKCFAGGSPGWQHLTVRCQLHKATAVTTRMHSLLEADISGLLNAMLYLSHLGHMHAFQEALANCICEGLVFASQRPSEEVQLRQQALLDECLPVQVGQRACRHIWRQHVIKVLLSNLRSLLNLSLRPRTSLRNFQAKKSKLMCSLI